MPNSKRVKNSKKKNKNSSRATTSIVALIVYIFLSVVLYLIFLSPNAYAVYLGNYRIATIQRIMSEEQFEINLLARLSNLNSNSPIVLIDEVSLIAVRANSGVLTPEQALNIAVANSLYYIGAATFIIGGEEIVTVSSYEEAKQIVFMIASREAFGTPRNIILYNGYIRENNRLSTDNISSLETALSILTSFRVHVELYVVSSGESLWSIASFANSTVDEILSLNEGVSGTSLYVGQVLTVPIYRPILTVLFEDYIEDYSIDYTESEDTIKKEYEYDTSSWRRKKYIRHNSI